MINVRKCPCYSKRANEYWICTVEKANSYNPFIYIYIYIYLYAKHHSHHITGSITIHQYVYIIVEDITWELRCSWSIACGRCSNYISILGLTPGSMDRAKTTVRHDEKHLTFGIWCVLYWRFDGNCVYQCMNSVRDSMHYYFQHKLHHIFWWPGI